MKTKLLTVAVITAALAGGNVYASGKVGGIKIDDGKKDFSFKLGGRIMWDVDHYDGAYNVVGGQDVTATTANLRRARLELKGKVYQDWAYTFSYNINNNGIDKAAIHYIGLKGHKFTIGQDKEPFGLEELTSSKWISTAERSMFWDTTNIDNNNFQIAYRGWGGPFTWATGYFQNANRADADGDDNWAWTSRFTFAPVVGKSNVLHFGVAYSMRDLGEAAAAGRLIDARAGVSSGLNGSVLRVGSAAAEGEDLLGVEALWIGGPFSAQFEYFGRDLDSIGATDESTSAWYLQGTWTITGESRGYKRKGAYADKVKPKGKGGAWELVAKLDNISADNGGANDPEVQAVTFGVNWYANKNVKMALNYTSTSSDNLVAAGVEDGATAVLLRTQIAF